MSSIHLPWSVGPSGIAIYDSHGQLVAECASQEAAAIIVKLMADASAQMKQRAADFREKDSFTLTS